VILTDKEYALTLEREYKEVSEDEIACFTEIVIDFLYKIDFFNWVLKNSHGVHASTGLPDYSMWWDDVMVKREGNKLIYKHLPGGGGHNIMIPTSLILNSVLTGYLLTGDRVMKEVAEQFCKGVVATMKGMLWDENDTKRYIMARNIIPKSHSYEIDGLEKIIDYSSWRTPKENWNAKRIRFPHNPFWGDIYVTNTRSKDDLPHLFRAVFYLPESNLSVAEETCQYIKGFCRDIVNHGYHIRTKDERGKTYIPKGGLASFLKYGKKAESAARLTVHLIGYGDSGRIDPGDGRNWFYELVAVNRHYFNYRIIHGFHMTAILYSLRNGDYETASKLLIGLRKRTDSLMKGHRLGIRNPRWYPDLAVFLLQAASVGLPLKPEEVRLIHREFLKTISSFEKYKYWNPKNLPEGRLLSYKPDYSNLIRPEELGLVFEYCYSPFRNPLGEEVVDEDFLKDFKIFR